ncbi:MAG TPA: hypothetical protein VGE62_02920 [Candidatus Paceibacterota bacterium]
MMATDTAPSYTNQENIIKSAETATSTQAAVVSVSLPATTTKQTVINPNAGVEARVRAYFKDTPLLAEIAYCESRYRQFDKDGSIFRGKVNNKDVGALQVNEYYHLERSKKLGYDIHTLEGNMAYSRLLYKESGARPWNSSSPCWMKSEVAQAMFGTKVLAENK